MKSKFLMSAGIFKQALRSNVSLAAAKNFRQASTLCFVGGPSMQSVALTLREKPSLESKEFFVVSSPTWLEKSHSDWNDKSWGQSIRYLTPPMKAIAKTLYPDYPEGDLMTYEIMKNIIKSQRMLLQDSGINLIEDHVDLIEQSNTGLVVHSGDETCVLTTHDNVHIVNAARREQDNFLREHPLPVRSYGEAYSLSKEEAMNEQYMVVIGSGLNLNWAARDFSNSQIIHLIPGGDRERPDLLSSLYASIRMEKTEIIPCGADALAISGIDLKTNKKIQVLVPASQVYSATGFCLNKGLVKATPEKVTQIDTGANPQALKEYTNLSGRRHKGATDMRGSVLPQGNLNIAYHQILGTIAELAHYPLTDAFAAMFMEGWKKAVLKKASVLGCQINPQFFLMVHDLLKHAVTSGIPREDQLWKVIQKTFDKGISPQEPGAPSIPMATNLEGGALSWDQFRALIEPMTVGQIDKTTTALDDDESPSSQSANRPS